MTEADIKVADETPIQETKPKRERTDEQKRVLEAARKKALEVRRERAELRRKETELEQQEKQEALDARKKRVEEGLAKNKPKAPEPEPEPEPRDHGFGTGRVSINGIWGGRERRDQA